MQRHVILPTLQEFFYFIFPESVGIYTDMPHHRVEREEGQWTTFSLHFIIEGKGYVEWEDDVYTLHKGDAFLYFPYQKQRYYSSKEEPWDVGWVHFYGSRVKDFLYENGFHSNLWTLHRWAELQELCTVLLHEAEEYGILHPSKLSSLTYAMLIEFMSYASPLTPNRGMDASDRIRKLLPLMQQKACEPFLLEEWAQQVGVSTHYFCKLFRKSISMTPLSFITLCRMQAAKKWLTEQPQLNIKEIAHRVGYPTASYFNQRFLEHEGMTPSEFRRLYNVM
ncbi:helix-turn-helix transcriptional regulator [Paenibacillus eucommiae]|uniref:AraC-like DNA-binding protein n=1 Tax=Paenibacillus eucommiae TaxID=1355755 RepID=A0ABS4JAA0_9BACL|nr:AraC family transcriptional regulator [Paenibacillus eucommiae]MBP1995669.1 AraC-like DNA-binding protein [Paenibacillus eucommiae]